MDRVLILTADAGFGHRSAANAIQEALKITYPQGIYSEIINPLENRLAPTILRDSQSDYDKWVRDVPELYRFGYQASDGAVPTTILERILTVLLFEVLKSTILDFNPQVIVTTYPLYQAPILAVLAVTQLKIPVITVFTDISTLHHIWFNSEVDMCVVPNEAVKSMAVSHGITPEKIFISGIPVHPSISTIQQSKSELRKEIGWDEDKTTILAVGGKRVANLAEMLNIINHSGYSLQLVIVAGNDQEFFMEMKGIAWHQKTLIYDFVNQMPKFMKAADIIISKAGGLIVSESLASGLPMLLIDVIPGQETGNAEFVVDNQAGMRINSPMELLESFCHLSLDNSARLKELQANAAKTGNPYAAMQIAEKIEAFIASPPNSINRPKELLVRVLELIDKYPLHLENGLSR
jgi:1,2-diacylglycerol 3-beta-galactosyltransferase